MKYFIYFVIFVVAISIIVGFFVVGSPGTQRLQRFDEQRIQDLQQIQNEILNFWQSKERLPENLTVLNDALRGVRIPQDPETQSTYLYSISGEQSFELCANFSTKNQGESSPLQSRVSKPFYAEYPLGYGQVSWEHDRGVVCFDRTIDKDFFPPRKEAN